MIGEKRLAKDSPTLANPASMGHPGVLCGSMLVHPPVPGAPIFYFQAYLPEGWETSRVSPVPPGALVAAQHFPKFRRRLRGPDTRLGHGTVC